MTELTTCELKLAQNKDAKVLARMSRDYVEHGLGWRWRTARILSKISDPETVVLVAEVEVAGARFIGGFAVMEFAMDKAVLSLLAVHPNLRRYGVGGKLLRWLHKSARVAGCFDIALQVRAGNLSARRFYRHMGYREEGYLPGYYSGREAAYQMKIALAKP